ncbi:hypothetical protein TF3313_0309 [Tannerella forsythia 3313]|nr:hypothetical protein TF3313_0309 [Tannerella forsythia 3313]
MQKTTHCFGYIKKILYVCKTNFKTKIR